MVINHRLNESQGAKYLDFFFSHSLKTREKYISFTQSVCIFFEGSVLLFNFGMIKFIQSCQKNINVNLIIQKLKSNTLPSKNIQTEQNQLSKINIFFARFEGTRGEKTQIFCTQVNKIAAVGNKKMTLIWKLKMVGLRTT